MDSTNICNKHTYFLEDVILEMENSNRKRGEKWGKVHITS